MAIHEVFVYGSRPVSVTLTQLRSFLAVVRSGSVTAAADELVVTQPSVSAAITALAREVGTPLLERDGRGVRPTPAGEAFAPYADRRHRAARHGPPGGARGRRGQRAHPAHRRRDDRGRVVRPRAHARVLARAPARCAWRLSVGNRGQVLDSLLAPQRGRRLRRAPPNDERIRAQPFRANELVLISAADDPLAGGGPVAPAQLGGRTWLLREPDSGTRSANEEFLSANALHGETLTVGSNGAIRQAARIGLGISFLSADAVTSDVDAGLLGVIAIDPAPPPRAWHVMRLAVGPARPLVDDFVAFVSASAR